MNSEEILYDDCILYELLVYSEWEQEPEFVVNDICLFFYSFTYFISSTNNVLYF